MQSLVDIPDKPNFKIGEVCRLTDTQPYVLRFWESEFPTLAPQKSRSGQRVYRRSDIETVLKIKHLLYEESYTISGARKKLETGGAAQPMTSSAPASKTPSVVRSSTQDRRFRKIREGLEEILTLLGPEGKNGG